MTIVCRSTPDLDVVKSGLLSDFDRFFSDVLTPFVQSNSSMVDNYPANLYETDKSFVLEVAVPGISKDDIEVNFEGRHLTVKGSYKDESSDEKRHYHVQSFQRGEFTRTITLPNQVDVDKIQAKVKNGILKLDIPKAKESLAKKITIN